MKDKYSFVSRDGEVIKTGDPFWFVSKEDYKVYTDVAIPNQLLPGENLCFGSEKAANNWVFDNKPIYSVKDFRELIKMIEEKFIAKTESNV
jgi:hypothetical protein